MKTKPQSFDKTKDELATVLANLKGKTQDLALEVLAQKLVDNYFKSNAARGRITEIAGSGIAITGMKVGFDIGKIKVHHWKTMFWPVDRFDVTQTVPGAIALGYVNNKQLYIAPQGALGPTLVIRHGMHAQYTTWNPSLIKMTPPRDSEAFVALERAKALGYLDLLNPKEEGTNVTLA